MNDMLSGTLSLYTTTTILLDLFDLPGTAPARIFSFPIDSFMALHYNIVALMCRVWSMFVCHIYDCMLADLEMAFVFPPANRKL